mgnify:CR=1 FL=1
MGSPYLVLVFRCRRIRRYSFNDRSIRRGHLNRGINAVFITVSLYIEADFEMLLPVAFLSGRVAISTARWG